MENGFLVGIINNTSTVQEIKLFSGELPVGVSVKVRNSRYTFESLQLMAANKAFIGNTLTTNADEGIEVEIVHNEKTEKIILNGRHEGSEIVINGKDNYIKVLCPPDAKFYIRLLFIDIQLI